MRSRPVRFLVGHSSRQHYVRKAISEHQKRAGIRPSAEATAKSNRNRPTGPAHPCWKGGRNILNGYVCIYRPDHPRRMPNGYVYEHILVAESHLGRALVRGEVVHHVDGDKANNLPDNLRVFPSQSAHMKHHHEEGPRVVG